MPDVCRGGGIEHTSLRRSRSASRAEAILRGPGLGPDRGRHFADSDPMRAAGRSCQGFPRRVTRRPRTRILQDPGCTPDSNHFPRGGIDSSSRRGSDAGLAGGPPRRRRAVGLDRGPDRLRLVLLDAGAGDALALRRARHPVCGVGPLGRVSRGGSARVRGRRVFSSRSRPGPRCTDGTHGARPRSTPGPPRPRVQVGPGPTVVGLRRPGSSLLRRARRSDFARPRPRLSGRVTGPAVAWLDHSTRAAGRPKPSGAGGQHAPRGESDAAAAPCAAHLCSTAPSRRFWTRRDRASAATSTVNVNLGDGFWHHPGAGGPRRVGAELCRFPQKAVAVGSAYSLLFAAGVEATGAGGSFSPVRCRAPRVPAKNGGSLIEPRRPGSPAATDIPHTVHAPAERGSSVEWRPAALTPSR